MNGGPSLVRSLLVGVGVGLLGGVVMFLLAERGASKGVRDWALRPIVVAAVDIPRGEPVTMELISQRSIPVAFFHEDFVRPEDAVKVINQVTHTPILAGEPISWAFVDDEVPPSRVDGPACAAMLRASGSSKLGAPGVKRLLEALEQRAKPDDPAR